ncbi:MAG: glycosyltransferase [Gemmatimonadales bacterium]|nr:glycosyltransferase [Gemmatimonadales bacterium]
MTGGHAPQVFHDPTGRRAPRVRAAVGVLGLAVVLLLGSLLTGVLRPPPRPVPALPGGPGRAALPRHPDALADGPRAPLPPLPAGRRTPDPITAGFYVSWDADALATVREHADRLDWVVAETGFLGARGAPPLRLERDDALLELLRATDGAPALHVMLTNFTGGRFDPDAVARLVGDAAVRDAAARLVADSARAWGAGGVMLDFERLPRELHAPVLAFAAALRAALPAGSVVSAAVPVDLADWPLEAYGAALDYVVPMLYDEHSGLDDAGPVAGEGWYAERLAAFAARVPAAKLLAGVGQYGYHWAPGAAGRGRDIGVPEAWQLARGLGLLPATDPASRTPVLRWTAADGEHAAWFLDATTAYNQLRLAQAAGTAGAALWRLGSEDPTLWRVLGRDGVRPDATGLEALPSTGALALAGRGELIRVTSSARPGARTVTLAPDGRVEASAVTSLPTGYAVERAAGAADAVALSFDDGPGGAWTGAILDTLAAHDARATFFVIGRAAQRQPDLLRRMVREGHEVGNHTFSHPDLGAVGEAQVRLELSATERLVEAVTGRQMTLFRPPYIGDAEPRTASRLLPMRVADELGYLTAALEIDPRDWERGRTPAAIVRGALDDLPRGRVILLHDGGGDRAATLAAVGPLVDSLRARGLRLETVSGLAGIPAARAMPPVPPAQAVRRWLDLASFSLLSGTELVFASLFTLAVVLGSLRLLLVGGLAVRQRRAAPYARRAADAAWVPTVSVVVPAFREEKTIARTVRSLLDQALPGLEVIVVDDGSPDGTAAAAAAAAGDDPRFRLVRQANGGKASALNAGVAIATGELIVAVDADTLFPPGALAALVRPLADPRVGAVAGNAKVGNRVNLVTRWQAIEYVTSQNLDRRAFSQLGCITVVPGAIGAWRREAIRVVGGFSGATLAEDQDLTMTLLRAGYRVAYAEEAVALTEAPDTLRSLLRQRFRWTFGTLQCAWKHRAPLLRRRGGPLGWVALPNVWLFQLLFPLVAPVADLLLLVALGRAGWAWHAEGGAAAWSQLATLLPWYLVFVVVDAAAALLGLLLEPGEDPRQALLVIPQRIAYRQVLYLAVLQAVATAIAGRARGWGVLERKGTVVLGST